MRVSGRRVEGADERGALACRAARAGPSSRMGTRTLGPKWASARCWAREDSVPGTVVMVGDSDAATPRPMSESASDTTAATRRAASGRRMARRARWITTSSSEGEADARRPRGRRAIRGPPQAAVWLSADAPRRALAQHRWHDPARRSR